MRTRSSIVGFQVISVLQAMKNLIVLPNKPYLNYQLILHYPTLILNHVLLNIFLTNGRPLGTMLSRTSSIPWNPFWGEWKHSCRADRREKVVLARLRIGHTHITHSFILKGEEPPECVSNEPFTVKHVLIDCIDFQLTRDRYYRVQDMKELFDTINVSSILDFLKEKFVKNDTTNVTTISNSKLVKYKRISFLMVSLGTWLL